LLVNHKRNIKTISTIEIDRLNILILLDPDVFAASGLSQSSLQESITALLDLEYPIVIRIEEAAFFDYTILLITGVIFIGAVLILWLFWKLLKWSLTRPKRKEDPVVETAVVEPLDEEKVKQDLVHLIKSDASTVVNTMSALLGDVSSEPSDGDLNE